MRGRERVDQPDGAHHRVVTVLFADLAGSTEFALRLDLEQYHLVLNRFLEHCARSIESAGGYVARFMGDGVLAYFGFPHVHEDDAARAIAAALDIRDGCARLGREFCLAIDARCGIASGDAIIGETIGSGDAREVPVFGGVANLAARLQTATRRGGILVSPKTHGETAHRFAFTRVPRLRLNGFPTIRHGWEVASGDRSPHRPPATRKSARARLIGREVERTIFEAAWLEACAGRGGMIEVSGEAGIGKSRLVDDWMCHVAGAGAQCCVAAADPLHVRTPLHLISRLLGDLAPAALPPAPPGDKLIPPEALAGQMLARLDRGPVFLVIEDMHWADASSREVLDAMAARVDAHSMLMVTTSRIARPPASPCAGFRSIRLAPLSQAQTHALVTRRTGGRLPGRALDEVVRRSGGIPLFAEELVTLMLATSDNRVSQLIPKTLAGLLLARLTRLGPAMALAQCAAILGIETPVCALEALAGRRGVDLAEGLLALDREDVAIVSGDPAVLRFRHALYRESALETLLSADRRSLYRDAAELLEASANRIVPDSALAEFWREAGEPVRALKALERAIKDARRQHAWREIRQLAEAALAMLRAIPQQQGGLKLELELRTLRAEALQITVGYSSPAARAAAGDAQRLAERVGEIDQTMIGVAGKWMAASSAGNYRGARLVADQALVLAQLHGGGEALAAAHMIDMTTRYRMGDLVGAEASFRSGSGFFDTPAFLNRTGAIPQTFGNAALVAILTGASMAARQRSAHALRAARRQNSAYDRCFAAYMVAMVEILLGADRKAAALGGCALRLAGTLGFPQFEAIARVVIGRARAGMGEVGAGIALLQEGLAAMAGTHSRNAQTMYLTWLAEAALSGGDVDTALQASDAALAINPEELFYRPETLRIRALALLRGGAVAEAGPLLQEGEALAIAMHAPWFTDRMKPLKARLALR